MKKLLIFLGALAAYGTDCTISDTVRTPFGGYFAGRIVVALNSPGSAQPLYSGSQTLTGWQTTIDVPASANGAVSFTLVCTDSITPTGTSYAARYQPTSGGGWAETWTPATGTTTIRAMRATTVPTPTTMFAPSQITPGTNGQVLQTSGGVSAWGSPLACATCVVTSGTYSDPSWLTGLAGSKISGNISGNAATATALAANGTNCSAGSYPLGVDASGNAESCTALPTAISGTANQITASASTGAVTLSLPATITGLTSVTSTGFTGSLTGNASTATALASTVASGRIWYGNGTGAPGSASTFVYDSANGRLGVGTSSPASAIHAQGTSNSNGNVRVLTENLRADGFSDLLAKNDLGRLSGISIIGSTNNFYGSASSGHAMLYAGTSTSLFFATNDAIRGVWHSATGNLAIGTTTDLGYGLHAANKGTNGNLLVFDPTATTGTSKAVFVAGQGQSGNLTEWRAYNATPGSGTLLVGINNNGTVFSGSNLGGAISTSGFGFNNGGGSFYATWSYETTRSAMYTGDAMAIGLQSSGAKLAWYSGTVGASAFDLSLSRASAGVLQVGDGGANANGTVTAASFVGALTGNASTATALSSTVASGRLWIGQGTGVPTSDSVICADTTNHRLGVGTCSPAYTLDVAGGARMQGIDGVAGIDMSINTASTNALKFSVNNSEKMRLASTTGNLLIGTTTDGNYKLDVQNSGSTGTFRVYDQTATTGSTLAVIQAGAGQSGNLTEWRNNAGTAGVWVTAAGTSIQATSGLVVGGGSGNVSMGYYSNDLRFGTGWAIGFSATSAANGTLDTGLTRAAAGYLKVTDGSTGLGKIVVSQSTPSASTDACTAGALWADASYVYACTSSGVIKRATLASF